MQDDFADTGRRKLDNGKPDNGYNNTSGNYANVRNDPEVIFLRYIGLALITIVTDAGNGACKLSVDDAKLDTVL